MTEYFLAVFVSVTGWWFSTGLILWLVHRPTASHKFTFSVMTLLMLAALPYSAVIAQDSSTGATVIGFGLGLVMWGWLEMGYLQGFVTGPRGKECPADASARHRLYYGLGTCLYHELALISIGTALLLISWDRPNQTALWIFVTLWTMRWSVKLNLILGVRNYNQNWLPSHLAYVDSYIPRRPMNALFPVSFFVGVIATCWVGSLSANALLIHERVGMTLVAALLALGTLEHLFLMLPMREAALWQWAAPEPKTAVASGDSR